MGEESAMLNKLASCRVRKQNGEDLKTSWLLSLTTLSVLCYLAWKAEKFPLEYHMMEHNNLDLCQGKENNFKPQQHYC